MKTILMKTARLSWVVSVLIGIALVIPVQAEEIGLVDLLVSKLGVTTPQAEGGAGSIFQLAKSNLSTDDFSSIAKSVPGMDSLLAAAPKETGGTTGALKGMSSMLGGSAGKLGGMAGLTGSFEKLGLGSDMVGKFVPVVLDYVNGKGGASVMNLLKSAL
ncbi:MAG: DUF2780 domain-containing protein [Pseudomonadota bacterium]